jgi:hypothetical protein
MPAEEDHLSAVLAAAVERAAAGPFNPDGTLTDEAAAGVRAVLDQADAPPPDDTSD